LILRRYILREISLTLFAVLGVLLLIFFSTRFVRILGDVAAGVLPGELVFSLLGLQSLKSLSLIIPIALYFAILLAFGRLYRDHEIVAMASSGLGQGWLTRTVMWIAPLFAVVVAVCAMYLSPWAARTASEIEHSAQQSSELSGIAAGKFRESRDGNFIMYVESVDEDRRTMRNVFVHSRNIQRQTVLFSESGYRYIDKTSGDEFMVMQDGYRYEGEAGLADYRIIRFGTHAIRVKTKNEETVRLSRKELPTEQLWKSNNPEYIAELQRRLVLPLSTIALVLVAVPLSRSRPREGRYARLFSAVLIYIIYNNLLGAAQGWVAAGKINPLLGVWWVPLLLVFYAAMLAKWQSRRKVPGLQRVLSRKAST
jgi:lipopolysaccharide export system permease protein